MLNNPNTYSCIVLIVVTAFLFLPIIKNLKNIFQMLSPPPPYYEDVPQKRKRETDEDNEFLEEEEMPLSTYAPLLQRRHTGFAFSGEAGHVPQLTDPKFNQQKP